MYRIPVAYRRMSAFVLTCLLLISFLSYPVPISASGFESVSKNTSGIPSEAISQAELDLIFSDPETFYPILMLSAANAESVKEACSSLSSSVFTFMNSLFEQSFHALEGLKLSIERFSQNVPEKGDKLLQICREFAADLTAFRMEAYQEGKNARNSSSLVPLDVLDALYQNDRSLESLIDEVKSMKEGSTSAGTAKTSGSSYLSAAASYMNTLLHSDLSYITVYNLGRYGSISPDPTNGTALERIQVYSGPSSKTEKVRKINVGESVTITDIERNRYGNYWGLLSEQEGYIWLGNSLYFGQSLSEAVCSYALNEYNNSPVKYLTNANKYNRYFGDSGSAWCAYFIVYSAVQAGVPDSVIPGSNRVKDGVYYCVGGCASLRNYMLKYCGALWHPFDSSYQPQPGDIAYYGSGKSVSTVKHVGLVTGSDENYLDALSSGTDTYILTVEGNTTADNYKSGCINTKQREIDPDGKTAGFYVLGYLTPAYSKLTE